MSARARLLALTLAGIVLLAAGLAEILGGGRLNPALRPAEKAAERLALATAGVYVSLRAVNAVLSTAQEIEIGASVAAQASLQPLKVLEPVDDTVERVADAVFAVAAGAAIASVGLGPVASIGLALAGVGLLGLAGCGLSKPLAAAEPACRRATRLGLVLGLLLPLGFAAGAALGERLTLPAWSEAMGELDRVTEQANLLLGESEALSDQGAETGEDGGMFSRFGRNLRAAGDSMEGALETLSRYRDAARVFLSEADTLLSASLTIIGVFALRIVVLPALLLWGAVTLMRRLA